MRTFLGSQTGRKWAMENAVEENQLWKKTVEFAENEKRESSSESMRNAMREKKNNRIIGLGYLYIEVFRFSPNVLPKKLTAVLLGNTRLSHAFEGSYLSRAVLHCWDFALLEYKISN